MAIASQDEIQKAYSGERIAIHYVRERFVSPLYRQLHLNQVRAVQGVIDWAQPAAILEIAPGPGRLTREIRPTGRLVCLEFNEGMIAEGRAACGEKAEWVRGDAFALPFGKQFDLVYSFRFIRHFHRADRERLYAQIHRVLRPGGHLVLDAINVRVAKPIRDARPDEYTVHDELYTPEGLREELGAAGFEVLRLEPVQKCFRWQHLSQVYLGPRADWLNRLVIGALERLPGADGLEWIVTCRRG
jgi:SAM-dependent methyltransferase